jgi:hypothetical protein
MLECWYGRKGLGNMKGKDQPQTKPAGNAPPPRPPKRTAVALGPEDDPERRRRKTETVRINLPAKVVGTNLGS